MENEIKNEKAMPDTKAEQDVELDIDKQEEIAGGMHAMGPNVAEVNGTAVAAGTFMAIFGSN